MLQSLLSILLVGALVSMGQEEIDESNVLVLTTDSFDNALSSNQHIMVEFYAPWCGHCKRLAPEYAQAATTLKDEVVLAKVDCTVEKSVCDSQGVRGYPTVKFFNNGEPTDFTGQRNADSIISWLRKKTGPPAVDVTIQNYDAFPTFSDVSILAVVESKDDENAITYIEVAKLLSEEYHFGISVEEAVVSKLGITSRPTIAMFTKFLEEPLIYSGEWNVNSIKEWIKSESFPILGEISPENYQKYVDRGLPFAWIFVDSSEMADGKPEGPSLQAARKALLKIPKGTLSAVYLDGEKFARHKTNLGLDGSLPGLIIIDDASNKKFKFLEASFSEETLSKFFEQYIAGELESFMKSEEIPESNDEDVKVVVGKNFEEIVMDSSKDVMVEFYAPWCGHCKSLAPIYESLGKSFSSEPDVVIAKVDATANDVPEQIQGFPTIIFYPKDKSAKTVYEGDRTLDNLKKFVYDNAESLKDKTIPKDEL